MVCFSHYLVVSILFFCLSYIIVLGIHSYYLSCFSDTNETPVASAEWVCDSPVNSEVEAKLRPLLVQMGNADKILGIQVHTSGSLCMHICMKEFY